MENETPPSNQSMRDSHVVAQQPSMTPKSESVSESTEQVIEGDRVLDRNPVTLVCSSCNQTVTTRVVKEPYRNKGELARLLCRYCCCLCIPCIYCPRACMTLNHYCPNCNDYQGTYQPRPQ